MLNALHTPCCFYKESATRIKMNDNLYLSIYQVIKLYSYNQKKYKNIKKLLKIGNKSDVIE